MKLPPGKWQFWTEIWGHCNFEDIRVQSLRLGSLKGIRRIYRILQEEDISENWEYGETRDRYRLFMDIDKYNIPRSPVIGFYRKKLRLWEGCDQYSLFFSEAKCRIRVWINGHDLGEVRESNPCLDIEPYINEERECVIELKVCRRNYAELVGKIMLNAGRKLNRCRYQDITFVQTKGQLGACGAKSEDSKEGVGIQMEREEMLPLFVPAGEERVIVPQIPEYGCNDVKLRLKGKNILVTVVCGGHVAGRLLLGCKHMPPVAGGASDTVFLCREWLQKSQVVMKCQALEKEACLEKIVVRKIYRPEK